MHRVDPVGAEGVRTLAGHIFVTHYVVMNMRECAARFTAVWSLSTSRPRTIVAALRADEDVEAKVAAANNGQLLHLPMDSMSAVKADLRRTLSEMDQNWRQCSRRLW